MHFQSLFTFRREPLKEEYISFVCVHGSHKVPSPPSTLKAFFRASERKMWTTSHRIREMIYALSAIKNKQNGEGCSRRSPVFLRACRKVVIRVCM